MGHAKEHDHGIEVRKIGILWTSWGTWYPGKELLFFSLSLSLSLNPCTKWWSGSEDIAIPEMPPVLSLRNMQFCVKIHFSLILHCDAGTRLPKLEIFRWFTFSFSWPFILRLWRRATVILWSHLGADLPRICLALRWSTANPGPGRSYLGGK